MGKSTCRSEATRFLGGNKVSFETFLFFLGLTFRLHERSEWGFAPHPDFFLKNKFSTKEHETKWKKQSQP